MKRPLAAVNTAKKWQTAPRLTTEGATDDAEVVLSVEEVEVVVDEEEREVVVDGGGEEVEANADDELLAGWEAAVSVHCRTTCTRGSPSGPLTGVIVIVHVSVMGPASLQQQREWVNDSEHPPRTTAKRTYRSSALFG